MADQSMASQGRTTEQQQLQDIRKTTKVKQPTHSYIHLIYFPLLLLFVIRLTFFFLPF